MARRDALNLSFTLESNQGNSQMKTEMLESAHFATACDLYAGDLADFLSELLDKLSDGDGVGVEPYQVPRRLIDPKTGDLLLNPVLLDDAPTLHTFVNEESRHYFEAQEVWPTGYFGSSIPHFSNVTQVREAVAEWVCSFAVLFYLPFFFCFECSCTEADFVQDFREGHSSFEGCTFLEGQRTNARDFC
ncbi:hypothetical protein BYT27DRAFT_6954941 [Phlegmacium glaucopus]|nr:hypothetical protein BYT27DRAFT_6954941 [Phlegmacium glaucopus]